VTIFTKAPTVNRRAYRYGLDELSSGSGIGTRFEEDLANNPFTGLTRDTRLDIAERGAPTYAFRAPGPRKEPDSELLDRDTANTKYGIQGQLSFDKPVRERTAKLLNEWATERLERESVLRRADATVTAGVGRFSASLMATALDPINIATAFIPVVGPARYARWLGQAGTAGRAGIRAGVGAAEGAIGAAAVEPLIYSQAQRQQRPYDLWDSMTNVVFGAVIGGGLHSAGGAVLDKLTARRAPTAGEALVSDIGTDRHAAALQGTVAALAEDRPVRVAEVMPAPVRRKTVAEQTDENFRAWFGESKVVDETGKPLVVYKGMYPYDYTKETDIDPGPAIDIIDRPSEFPSFNKGEPGVKIAGFFGDKETANRFAEGMGENSAVFPTYLSFQKPFVIDAAGRKAGQIQFGEEGREFRDAVRSGEYDSVIIKNTADEGTVYVALKPEQVKSAIGNSGVFDPQSASLTDFSPDAIRKLHEPDEPIAESITRIEQTVAGRIEADDSIEAQIKEAEESLAQIEPLIREGDEAEMTAANELTSQANREAKAYEVMASCYLRRA
jgi:hypothetical protein